VQLWVNLPAKHKMAPPRYQAITSAQIPSAPLGGGTMRVIAGTLAGVTGPAKTFTPIEVGDLRLPAGAHAEIAVPDGHTTALVVLRGALRVNGSDAVGAAEVGLFDRAGERIVLDADADTMALLLGGAPIEEPIVGHGPFVMNTEAEIRQAMLDYRDGRMGRLSP
jgi:redox-sensitive bicupin YhaK (pirin superfamily)